MLYETLKWPQIAPFGLSSKKIPDPLPISRIMACTLLNLSIGYAESLKAGKPNNFKSLGSK
jgi:hypothetical protein